jgi:hypothetical protein
MENSNALQSDQKTEQNVRFENVALYLVAGHGIRRIDCKNLALKTQQQHAQFDDAIEYQYLEKRKRYPRGGFLTGSDVWLRVVPLASAIDPDYFMVPDGPELFRSRYASYDMRYVADFEDKLTAAKVPMLFSIGTGHRGECGCHFCSHRLKDGSSDSATVDSVAIAENCPLPIA